MNSSVWCQKPAANWVFVSCCWQSSRGVCVLYLLFWHIFASLTTSGQCVSVFQWCVCCCLEATDFTLKVTGSVVSCFPGHSSWRSQYSAWFHVLPQMSWLSPSRPPHLCCNKQHRPAPKHSICWSCWFFTARLKGAMCRMKAVMWFDDVNWTWKLEEAAHCKNCPSEQDVFINMLQKVPFF